VRLGNLGEGEGLHDREREAPGLDQLADLAERVNRAAGVAAAEPHPMLPGAAEVGEREDVSGAAGELDELGQDAAPGDAAAPASGWTDRSSAPSATSVSAAATSGPTGEDSG
jgi:hypothetical protein